ncbi:MAG: FAD-dependent oxidoreductase [Crocinitomicaceae bacterium]|nr:FAD-dependent oxidoreductase [Flavobacteriales bacterium]NQZ36917.1 FAD-dependent oxidoreductase [Crocinitomicaceae bacterium]
MNNENPLSSDEALILLSKRHPELRVLTDSVNSNEYEKERLVFNRKFDFRPAAIILVTKTEQVQTIVELANNATFDLTVKSGGHDHEGECSATDSWQINFREMNSVLPTLDGIKIKKDYKIKKEQDGLRVTIGPGARFNKIKPVLDEHNLGIPHGTCKTVGIAGYTMGGGWGPWTRKYGMACEYLVGATIVLGDGQCLQLTENDTDTNKQQLLWALRGGGGLSYGIVTELIFKPFVLPFIAFSFKIDASKFFPGVNAVTIIEFWEDIVKEGKNPSLIGTNLKLEAQHVQTYEDRASDAKLKCTMNGYFGGTFLELVEAIIAWSRLLNKNNPLAVDELITLIKDKANDAITIISHIVPEGETLTVEILRDNWPFNWDTTHDLNLDPDCPAPHKLTSRLANPEWDNSSREALVRSLQSPLLPTLEEGNNNGEQFKFQTFITLGAIAGNFYESHDDSTDRVSSAFPYKKQLFTVQYQAWWNQPTRVENECDECEECDETGGIEEKRVNRKFSNRVQDWIETCRDFDIPHTGGAFISFKDSSIPTERYFSQNYQDLIDVKVDHSEDPKILFKSRKTIL